MYPTQSQYCQFPVPLQHPANSLCSQTGQTDHLLPDKYSKCHHMGHHETTAWLLDMSTANGRLPFLGYHSSGCTKTEEKPSNGMTVRGCSYLSSRLLLSCWICSCCAAVSGVQRLLELKL